MYPIHPVYPADTLCIPCIPMYPYVSFGENNKFSGKSHFRILKIHIGYTGTHRDTRDTWGNQGHPLDARGASDA